MLDLLAFIHASKIDNDGIAETIVDLAAQSKDRNDFENRISKMINGA